MSAPSDDTNHSPEIHLYNGSAEEQPQPSTSGGASPEQEGAVAAQPHPRRPTPNLIQLCLRGLGLCRLLLSRLALRFVAHPLSQHALDAACQALAVAEQAVTGSEPQSKHVMWYVLTPVSMLLMVVRTGAELAERFLDIELPQNRHLVNWLQARRRRLEQMQMSAARFSVQRVDRKRPSETNLPSASAEEPVASPPSSESSLSDEEHHSSSSKEEESALPVTPGDKSIYFSIDLEMLPEEEKQVETEEISGKADEKIEKPEEHAQKEKAEEQQPEITGEMRSVVQAEPSAPPGYLIAGDEAEQAAINVVRPQPSTTLASSGDILSAEGASHSGSDTAKTKGKASSKSPMGGHFLLSVFGIKWG